ncbi:MAG: type II toxin-antitoxin system VapC family toxin [Candidatus Lokiarchaeota archaeon]|nr:type II toxin-antitoxin system VapC family toxin [Candidatus Lokiarchaeota archaeon]
MVVLDTDLLAAFLRKKEYGFEVIHHLRKERAELKSTVFNVAELYKGCYAMKNVAKGLNKVKALVATLNEILQFDENSIQEYAKIASDLKKRGKMVGTLDELIGSVCIAHGEKIYTRNTEHFSKIDGLPIIDWYKLGEQLDHS